MSFIGELGDIVGDVIEMGGDIVENKVGLESAKINRINTNNEIAKAKAISQLQAEKENRELMKKILIWGFGFIALITVLKTLHSMGFIKSK